MYPHMDGKRVFLNAVRGMVMSTQAALAKTGMTWDDIQWFVPHQANSADQREGRRGREDSAGEGPQHDPVLRQHHGGDGAADDRSLAPAGQGQEGRSDPVVRVRLRLHLGRRDLHDLVDPTVSVNVVRASRCGAIRMHCNRTTRRGGDRRRRRRDEHERSSAGTPARVPDVRCQHVIASGEASCAAFVQTRRDAHRTAVKSIAPAVSAWSSSIRVGRRAGVSDRHR